MKMKTVNIAIPAYNEESNISNLLTSIQKQKQQNFKIKNVFVINDGGKDDTALIVKGFSKKYKIIKLINGKKREGKSSRLNQVFKISNSDILVLLDADVMLGNELVIKEIVKSFSNNNIGVVGACVMPLTGKKFFEKIVVRSVEIWFDAVRELNNGINIHNHIAMGCALSKKLYKKIKLPKIIVADDNFIFFKNIKIGLKFGFARKAKIYFRAPSTLNDFLSQTTRFIKSKDQIADIFGKWVYEYYDVPTKNKLRAIMNAVKRDAFSSLLAIIIQIFARLTLFSYNNKKQQRFWRTVHSTKRLALL